MIAPIKQNGTLWPTHKSLPMLPALANHHWPRHQPVQVLTWIAGLGQKELSAPSLCHLPPAPRDPKKQLSPYNSKTLSQNRGTYRRIRISYWRPKAPACRISCTSVIARPRWGRSDGAWNAEQVRIPGSGVAWGWNKYIFKLEMCSKPHSFFFVFGNITIFTGVAKEHSASPFGSWAAFECRGRSPSWKLCW